jgi:LacI family transcriptional regulator
MTALSLCIVVAGALSCQVTSANVPSNRCHAYIYNERYQHSALGQTVVVHAKVADSAIICLRINNVFGLANEGQFAVKRQRRPARKLAAASARVKTPGSGTKPNGGSQTTNGGTQTISDVALRAGVSIKTVSRVINRETGVREATAQRVQQAIRELNYRPNISARSLASPRAYLFALLYDNPSDHYIVNVQDGALSACEQARYGLLLQPCNVGNSRIVDVVFSMIAERRPGGLLLTPPVCDHTELLAALDTDGIDYVCIAPSNEQRGKPFVAVDDRSAGRELTNFLIAHGHRHIAFIKGHPLHGAAARRLTGFLDAHHEHKLPVNEQLIANGMFSFESGVECGRRLLRLPNRPTAVFAGNDDMAAGVLYAAHEMGLEVPRQLSVAGYDDTPIARYVFPNLTTIRQPIRAMAQGAVECLVNAIRARTQPLVAGSQSQRFPFELIVRDSVAPYRP